MLRSLKTDTDGKVTTWICAHWKTFPPFGAGQDVENLRRSKEITSAQYQRLAIWDRECGLATMEAGKCPTCPHVRRVEMRRPVPVLISPDGTVTPVVDAIASESASWNRHLAGITTRHTSSGRGRSGGVRQETHE